jgi:hypothetical protein
MSLKKIATLPDIELLNKLFVYDDGLLIRRTLDVSDAEYIGISEKAVRQWNTRYAGLEAGHCFTSTYGTLSKQVRILGKSYYVHRVIYKMLTGLEPEIIDHIDGNPLNNKIDNLRSVDNQTNTKNAKRSKANTSGHTGVSFAKTAGRWEAYIWKDCKKINLGLFDILEDAIAARKRAEVELDYHENHGRVVV